MPGGVASATPLREWAARHGAALEPATSTRDALEGLRAGRYQLVVCDLTRAADRALDWLAALRARGTAVPFVLLTPPEIPPRAHTLGASYCLPARSLSEPIFDEVVALATAKRPEPRAPEGERAPAMMWRTSPDGSFTRFTREWCRFRGRDEREERGSGWMSGLHPDDANRWLECFRGALSSGESLQVDVRVRRADGAWRWLRMRGLAGRSREGAFAGYLGTAFDVTDLVEARDELRTEVERLASLNADLEEFAYAAAHDLDEPLRTLENVLARVTGEGAAPSLELARANARRMRALVRDLLECARVGASETHRERIDLSTPLDWALQNLSRRIRESAARVTRDSLPVARCDPVQIARVFQNLVANAIKFRGDALPRVHVSGRLMGDAVQIRVSDNGIGIDPEHHESVFEPFKRVHARPSAPTGADSESGSGIGLALCKRIIERHAGRIHVESEPGKGSTFCFTLKG